MAAVTEALRQGADGVEIDVWLAEDGTLVCAHDLAVRRRPQRARHAARAARRRWQRPRRRPRVVVEAKPVADPAVAGADRLRPGRRAAHLRGQSDITISSFDPDLLAMIRATCSDLPVRTALLGEKSAAGRRGRGARLPDGHDEVHLPLVAVRRSPRPWRRRSGWACRSRSGRSTAADLSWAAELGVDAVITDDVLAAWSELDRAAAGRECRRLKRTGPALPRGSAGPVA